MDSTLQNKPGFLSRAKLISENKKPDFLSRSKLVSSPEEKYVSDEQVQRDIERGQATGVSRILEAGLGLPGDLINFVGGLFGYEPNAPGSEKLQEISEKVTGGYTKPKNELEESVGETLQDMTLFALPGAKHYGIARNIGIPIVANLVKEGIKYTGAGEGKQAAGKIGTMVLLDILGHRANLGTAKEYASSLFQKADESIPKGLSIKASSLENSLNALEKSFKAGGERPATGDALKKISEIRDEIKNGKIDLKNLVAYRPSINEWIEKYKGFDIQASPAIKKKIINNLNQVKGEVIKAAEEYGSKYNPEYLKLSQSANEAYSAYAQSNKITNFIEKHASSKLKSTGAKALLGVGLTGGTGALGGALGVSAGSAATLGAGLGYKIFKTILRSKSPTLRNHYFQILEGASKGNAAQVIKNAKALDKELLHMDITGEIDEQTNEG
jgi:hypothetical protein